MAPRAPSEPYPGTMIAGDAGYVAVGTTDGVTVIGHMNFTGRYDIRTSTDPWPTRGGRATTVEVQEQEKSAATGWIWRNTQLWSLSASAYGQRVGTGRPGIDPQAIAKPLGPYLRDYRYKARSCNSYGCSAWSSYSLRIKVKYDRPPYVGPGFSSEPNPFFGVTLSWTAPPGVGANTVYVLESRRVRAATAAKDYAGGPALVYKGTALTYQDEFLASGDYGYFVRACGGTVDAPENCGATSALAVKVSNDDPAGAPSGAVDKLERPSHVDADGRITLTWDAVAGVDEYRVEESSNPEFEPASVYSVTSGTELSIANALNSGDHYYCIRTCLKGVCQVGYTRNRAPVSSVPFLPQQEFVASGGGHSCAVSMLDGAVKCWGKNSVGQLGNGMTNAGATAPVTVTGLAAVKQLALGYDHSCALLSDKTVRCWGYNASGQVGDGTTTDRWSPVAVSGLGDVVAISAGAHHTCAVLSSGGAKCWGGNGNGQLGDGTTTRRSTPVAVSGLSAGVAGITAGAAHTCAQLMAGGAKCWGYNGKGQLGDGTTTQYTVPVTVSALSAVTALSAGNNHTCAMAASTIKCWGENLYGQLGDGTTTHRTTPVSVMIGGQAVALATGLMTNQSSSCASFPGGNLKCWGQNSYGQLGDGSTINRLNPVDALILGSPAVTLNGVSAIGTGSSANHTCAALSATTVRCWGKNALGQLGDGTTANRSIPAAVTDPF